MRDLGKGYIWSQWSPESNDEGFIDFIIYGSDDSETIGRIEGHEFPVTLSDLRSLRDHVASLVARCEAIVTEQSQAS